MDNTLKHYVSSTYIVLDDKLYLWKDILQFRKEQLIAIQSTRAKQLTLFEDLREDCRPAIAKRGVDRYQQPTFLDIL